MGREWHRGSGSAKTSWSWRAFLGRERRDEEETPRSGGLPVGCMRAVFRLLEFPHGFHQTTSSSVKCSHSFRIDDLRLRRGSSSQSHFECRFSTGYDAPRNSLEIGHRHSSRSAVEEEERLEIQKHRPNIKIKTSIGDRSSSSEPDNFNSPSCKTPNLVARLMGLDPLPYDSSSPPSVSTVYYSGRQHVTVGSARRRRRVNENYLERDSDIPGVRSLPETPRASSARRSDVDHHHRLSLQINKENMTVHDEIVLGRISAALGKKKTSLGLKENGDNLGKSISPGSYAKQMMRHVKERVNRRVGLDITNTMKNGSSEFHDRTKIGKSSAAGNSHVTNNKTPKALSRQKLRSTVLRKGTAEETTAQTDRSVTWTTTDVVRSKQEEFFVKPSTGGSGAKKSKRIPFSTGLRPVNPPSTAKIFRQGIRDSSRDLKLSTSHSKSRCWSNARPRSTTSVITVAANAEAEKDDVPPQLNNPHPFDLSLSFYLDAPSAYPVSNRWNRKLLLQQDETLFAKHGPNLMKLCAKLRGFSGENSRAMDGVDGLFGGDLFPAMTMDVEDLQKLGICLQNHILELLVHETALELISCH